MTRSCGVLMPVFSLPSKYSIGSFGKWAYKFVDFLKKSGHDYWQVLPMCQTGYGDSPYQTTCDISGNPYFIDLETLRDERLLTYREVMRAIDKSDLIDYGKLYNERYPLLRKAFSRFDRTDKHFKAFLKTGDYRDYALFMALTEKFNAPWYNWSDEFKKRDEAALGKFEAENKDEVLFWQFVQYEFWKQYFALKKYANKRGIKIIGDMPLYFAYNSVEVWRSPEEFMLDENYTPKKVAGVPPDYFCADGQLWGNPVYNYDVMKKNDYAFFKSRLNHVLSVYDYVRIDHFRGLDRFWAVDYGKPTARDGEWLKAPGREIFASFEHKDRIIAEDLGVIDDGVRDLIKTVGVPGMKVLSFAFDSGKDNPYLPWNVGENSVAYTGTHDNDTLVGHFKSLSKDAFERQKAMVKESLDYLKIFRPIGGIYPIAEAVLDIAYACDAKLTVVPLQDELLLGGEYRINAPGSTGCWRVRIKESVLTDTLCAAMKRRAKRFKRA